MVSNVDINSVLAVYRVLQKTHLKIREGEILIMFDPVTKNPETEKTRQLNMKVSDT